MFQYARRVHFAETDTAGMVHFAVFFRYMEEAEHALWRAAGMTIHASRLPASATRADAVPSEGADLTWPRVSATFDFKQPLIFEDEFEVQVTIARVTTRTIQYAHAIMRGETTIGTGSITVACVRRNADDVMKAVEIPTEILTHLRAVI